VHLRNRRVPSDQHRRIPATLRQRLAQHPGLDPDSDGVPTYCLEGSLFNASTVVQWLRDGLELFERSAEVNNLAEEVPDSGGVMLVPAFTGWGTPHWNPEARGLL